MAGAHGRAQPSAWVKTGDGNLKRTCRRNPPRNSPAATQARDPVDYFGAADACAALAAASFTRSSNAFSSGSIFQDLASER